MRILADTHILLWALSDDDRLTEQAREMIADGANQVAASVVSLWEVEIKHTAHPARMPVCAADLATWCHLAGFDIVDVAERHVLALEGLSPHDDAHPHKDPFDRMLICQAKTDGLLLVTHDKALCGYGEPCVRLV